jgi:hypothetical protein
MASDESDGEASTEVDATDELGADDPGPDDVD